MNYQRQQLFGSWYRSEVLKNGSVQTELAQMTVDGEYEFAFSIHDKQGQIIQHSIELGDWGLVGDIHFTIAKAEYINEEQYEADFTDPDNYHAYKVLELSHQIFKYQHIVSNEVFILRRVIDKIAHC
jgi:hypothetical protein